MYKAESRIFHRLQSEISDGILKGIKLFFNYKVTMRSLTANEYKYQQNQKVISHQLIVKFFFI